MTLNIKEKSDLNNIRIATSYPNTLKKFLEKENIKSDLHIINGSVEISPSMGLADAVCDIVSSGSTLFENNLVEVIKLLDSEAVLVQSEKVKKEIYDEIKNLTFRIRSVLLAKKFKYILMNAPNKSINKISKILPVLKVQQSFLWQKTDGVLFIQLSIMKIFGI